MTTVRAPMSRRRAAGFALCVAALHFAFAVFLTFYLLTAAYNFAGASVGSIEQLYKLGQGPKLGFLGIWVATVPVPFAASALWHSAHRSRTWLAPAFGMVLSLVLCMLAIGSFQVPEMGGG